MADFPKKAFGTIKSNVQKGINSIDVDAVKGRVSSAGTFFAEKAVAAKDAAVATKDDIEAKLTELDRMLADCITEYNDAYTLMNDKGVQLFIIRSRAVDTIAFVENLINSISNHPKEFDSDFEAVNRSRATFTDSCDYADRELQAARAAAGSAGAGLAAGASVAFMAPTAAMWIATTFGTASTGAAISTLSGAAATNAALAWLGGGAAAAGGGGMAAGNALLAMAGPVGWSIAGAALLGSIILFVTKRTKLNKEKNAEIEVVKKNTEAIMEVDAKLAALLSETNAIHFGLNTLYVECLADYGADYSTLSLQQKTRLGTLVNNTLALSKMFERTIE